MARTAFVEQSGKITPTHLAKWVTDGVITDGGTLTSLNAVIVSGEVVSVATKILAETTSIDPTVNGLQTYGYYTLGDGGNAFYTRTIGLTLGGFQSADGAFWQIADIVLNVRMFGARGDGVTNDTTAVQNAMDYAASTDIKGIFVPSSTGGFLVDTLSPPSDVLLYGNGYYGRYSSGQNATSRSTLVANSAGYVIGGTVSGFCVNGITFKGGGSGANQGGINITGGFWNAIRNCFFYNFANEAIVDNSNAVTITDCLADDCLLNRTRSGFSGVMTLTGTDAMIARNEMSASLLAISSASLYCCAYAFIGGGNHFISDCVGEISDIGFYFAAFALCRITSCRADNNAGHGFLGGAQFSNCYALNNSQQGANLYSGFNLNNAQGVQLVGCIAQGVLHKYGFDDTAGAHADPNARPYFVGCSSGGAITGDFGIQTFSAIADYVQARDAIVNALFHAPAAGTTPSVAGCTFLVVAGQGAVTITNFLDGYSGQSLYVLGDGNQKVAYNATIFNNTGNTKVLQAANVYQFKLYNGVWYEITGSAQPFFPPITVTNATQTLNWYETFVIGDRAGTITLTLYDPASAIGQQVTIKTIQAQAINSASANVVPLVGGAAGTAIVPNTAGRWATLVSDGTNWVTMAGN